jgi:hypothetical protein
MASGKGDEEAEELEEDQEEDENDSYLRVFAEEDTAEREGD